MAPVPRLNRPHQTALNHTLAASGLTAVPRTPAEEEGRASALLDLALSLLDSAIDLLSNHITADRQLQQPSRLLPGGTLGKHLRHVIETFQAFVRPLADRPGASRPGERDRVLEINYDAIRPSSERGPLARSVPVCRKAMGAVRADLARWGERCRANQPTAELGEGVAGEAGTHGLAGEFGRRVHLVAVTPTRQEMSSSVGREVSGPRAVGINVRR